jgi:hypothetical protein
MKLKNIIAAIASVAVFVGCQTEPMVGSFADFELNKTFISIPLEGGSSEIAITAADAWEVTKHYDTGKKDDDKKAIMDYAPSWITLSATSGAAGQSSLTITAEATTSGREVELQLKSGSKLQHIVVRQGSVEAEEATAAEVNAGPDGKTYIVEGTVTSIVNTTYGNWYMVDKAGDEVYIYGTLDKNGKTKNFLSLGLEVGDVVKVSGPKTTYNGTVELVDVTVLSIQKALLKIESVEPQEVSKEGGDVTVKVTIKGKGVYAEVPADVDWISYKKTVFKAGVPTLFEKNPADTAILSFSVVPNEGLMPRTATIGLSSSDSKSITFSVSQKSNAPDVKPIADAIADGFAHVHGTVMAICARGYILADESGAMLAYYGSAFDAGKYKIGDEIEIVDTFAAYNYGLQMSCDGKADGFVLENKIKEGNGTVTYPEPVVLTSEKVDEIIASIDGKDKTKATDAIKIQYVEITGTPKKSGNYTNIYLDGYDAGDFSAYQLPAEFDLASKLDKKVVIRGYLQSISGGKHLNIVFTSMEDAQ